MERIINRKGSSIENIAKACAKTPNACDYVYSNANRLAAQWLVEHQPYSANPVIRQINLKSKSYLDLVMALREAYVAGMILGACLQQDHNDNQQLVENNLKFRI